MGSGEYFTMIINILYFTFRIETYLSHHNMFLLSDVPADSSAGDHFFSFVVERQSENVAPVSVALVLRHRRLGADRADAHLYGS